MKHLLKLNPVIILLLILLCLWGVSSTPPFWVTVTVTVVAISLFIILCARAKVGIDESEELDEYYLDDEFPHDEDNRSLE